MTVHASNSTRPDNPDLEIARLLDRLMTLMDESAKSEIVHRTVGNPCRESTGAAKTLIWHIESGNAVYTLIKQPLQDRTTLSPREQEIVRLVSNGFPNKGIAHKLAISQHTVNTHVRRIFDKLGVSSRAEMVAYALQSGLVTHTVSYN